MRTSNATEPADHVRPRQMVLWGVFAALLVLGIALWFLFSARIIPMFDLLTDR